MVFYPGFDIHPSTEPLGFTYGEGVFGPPVELRRLDAIRESLRDPDCTGPDPVYAIAMDVGRNEHRAFLHAHYLLYGAVAYAAGRLGREPVRSQGHIHAVSARSGWSTPEVYEIWQGRAFIYMQERAEDDPGRCFAVEAGPGGVVIVPPYWAHAAISADPASPLVFGAWCDRQYGFEYAGVRARRGLAWFPILDESGAIAWERNMLYSTSELTIKSPEAYDALGIEAGVPIYTQFERDHKRFLFVPEPAGQAALWDGFIP